jgi:tetratricopeptide (TPR) repeat protein
LSSQTNRTEFARSVARIGQQIADALSHAHRQGMLHRDVKPSNIILDEDGRAWLSDFGLALLDDCDQLTGEGDAVGTLRYMAPERFNGKGDARSDVYSLGLTLYELLAADSPVPRVDRATLIHQVLHEEPPAPRSVDPLVPRDLETIILKAISKDPALRYQTAAEFAEDLGRFLVDRPPTARRLRWWERTWRWIQRNRALTALTVTTLLALSLGLGMTYAQWQRATDHLVEANRQTERAEKGYAAVRKMVDDIFSAFNGDAVESRSIALPLPVRKHLLGLAIEHHHELTAVSDDDPESQANLAHSCLRIAEVQFSVGRGSQAVEACEEAEKLLRRATARYPDHDELRALWATVTSQLGYYQLSVNRIAAARESLDQAIAHWNDLLAVEPDQPDYLNGLAKSYNCLGYLLSHDNSPPASLEASLHYHSLAVDIRRRLVAEHPQNLIYQRSLGLALSNFAYSKAMSGGDKLRDFRELPDRYERAMQQFVLALDAQEDLVSRNPGLVPLKRDLANTLVNISEIHYCTKQYTQALQRSDQAIALYSEMQLQEPQSNGGESIAAALAQSARVLTRLRRRDEAIASYLRSIQVLRELVDSNNERPTPRIRLSQYLGELAPLLRKTGRFGEAIETAEQRRWLAAGKPDLLFAVAHELARTTTAVTVQLKELDDPSSNGKGNDRSQRQTAEDELRRAAQLAVDVLEESIASGWQDFARLLPNSNSGAAFIPVWERAESSRLPAELAFAFDIRARRRLAQFQLGHAVADWCRLFAQGHSAPNTYRALLQIYRVPLLGL